MNVRTLKIQAMLEDLGLSKPIANSSEQRGMIVAPSCAGCADKKEGDSAVLACVVGG